MVNLLAHFRSKFYLDNYTYISNSSLRYINDSIIEWIDGYSTKILKGKEQNDDFLHGFYVGLFSIKNLSVSKKWLD